VRRAFTIVELLVTVGIIAVLAGLLLAGIGSARGAAQSRRQASNLRQLHVAWTMYADQSGGSVLPGFIETKVQEAWKIRSKAPTKLPGSDSDRLPREVSQSYPWRLMPCMDNSWDVMMDQRPGEASAQTAASASPWQDLPGAASPDPLSSIASLAPDTPGRTVALQASHGYNGWHIGGVWRARNEGPPRLALGDAKPTAALAATLGTSPTTPVMVVMQKVAAARLPDRLTLFCPAATLPAGGPDDRPHPEAPGSPMVAPPTLADARIWETSTTDSDAVMLSRPQSIPVRREKGSIQRATIDGSVQAATLSELCDLRCWVDLPAWPEGPQPGPAFTATP
jgi:prepilin-type N-terminal cleavage/methylation domain-containing protein